MPFYAHLCGTTGAIDTLESVDSLTSQLTCYMTVVDTVNALTRSPWGVPRVWYILASDSLHL